MNPLKFHNAQETNLEQLSKRGRCGPKALKITLTLLPAMYLTTHTAALQPISNLGYHLASIELSLVSPCTTTNT